MRDGGGDKRTERRRRARRGARAAARAVSRARRVRAERFLVLQEEAARLQRAVITRRKVLPIHRAANDEQVAKLEQQMVAAAAERASLRGQMATLEREMDAAMGVAAERAPSSGAAAAPPRAAATCPRLSGRRRTRRRTEPAARAPSTPRTRTTTTTTRMTERPRAALRVEARERACG
jgi:hypothetical protein